MVQLYTLCETATIVVQLKTIQRLKFVSTVTRKHCCSKFCNMFPSFLWSIPWAQVLVCPLMSHARRIITNIHAFITVQALGCFCQTVYTLVVWCIGVCIPWFSSVCVNSLQAMAHILSLLCIDCRYFTFTT